MNMANLKNIRRSLGVSQIRLAGMVGVSMLTIRMWEGGASTPNPNNMARLKAVIGRLQAKEATKELKRTT